MAWIILELVLIIPVALLEWTAICRKSMLIMLVSDLIAFLPLICLGVTRLY